MLLGSGSVILFYRSADLDLKEILTNALYIWPGVDPYRAFHFEVVPDLASQNDTDPDPQQ